MMDWQPIETAPKDGSFILLYCPDGDSYFDRFGAGSWDGFEPYEKEMGAPGTWVHFMDGKPTHWMPLPAPPRP